MLASEAAKALGVSQATVSRIARGNRRPSMDLIEKIRSVFGWTIESQADALRESTARYAVEFKMRMERRSYRATRATEGAELDATRERS